MKQASDAQIHTIKTLVSKGEAYCKAHISECNNAIRVGFAQGLNNCPRWEGYRVTILEYLSRV